MPKPPKTLYICQSCGHEQAKWSGRCPQCGEWNSLVETAHRSDSSGTSITSGSSPIRLSEATSQPSARLITGIGEFDRVLGGGIVPGSAILLAGEPGIGKSTLLLQVAACIGSGNPTPTVGARSPRPTVLYISGEESPSQIKLRADRLGIDASNIQILAETNVDSLISLITPNFPKVPNSLIVVDSIQTLTTEDLNAGAGTISQVRECSQRLITVSKQMNVPLILVGHITKEGSIAGPKVLEHIVDVVLYLEGDKFHSFRLLRSYKNRYGSAQEVGVFEMGERGLQEVKNPSDVFLSERAQGVPGSVVTATMEGTRPVLVEVQALVTNTPLAYPRRTASGFGLNRLNLLIAVLQKHLRLPLQNKDIYVNVASGFRVSEPAADLAASLAIVSGFKDKPIDPRTCVFGEVGLSGEVRKVSQSERRIREARKLGFTKIISPENVRSVQEALGLSTKLQAPSSK